MCYEKKKRIVYWIVFKYCSKKKERNYLMKKNKRNKKTTSLTVIFWAFNLQMIGLKIYFFVKCMKQKLYKYLYEEHWMNFLDLKIQI